MEKAGREGESGCVRPPSPAACPPPARPGPLYNPPGVHTPSLPRPSLLTRTCLPSPGRGPADPQGSPPAADREGLKAPQLPAPCPGEPLPCGDMNSKLVQVHGVGGTGREEGGPVVRRVGSRQAQRNGTEKEESERAMGRQRRRGKEIPRKQQAEGRDRLRDGRTKLRRGERHRVPERDGDPQTDRETDVGR